MRRSFRTIHGGSSSVRSRVDYPSTSQKDWKNFCSLFPYLWDYRGRVAAVLAVLVLGKVAFVGMSLALKAMVDTLAPPANSAILQVPLAVFLGYGILRSASALFNELRDVLFCRVRYRAMRVLSVRTLRHLHDLSLRFHLGRETGAIFRDLDRGTQSVSSVLNYMVFHFVPVSAEFLIVSSYLFWNYPVRMGATVILTVLVYIVFTVCVTNWRISFRVRMNVLESQSSHHAVDSVINYETVKYFGREDEECERYKDVLRSWEDCAVSTQLSMSALNFGQSMIITIGVVVIMIFTSMEVVAGVLTVGDLVLVNTMMLQLFLPLSVLGVVYRALRYAMTDMGAAFRLLDAKKEIMDCPHPLAFPSKKLHFSLRNVSFFYHKERQILRNISFEIPPGQRLAIVGATGSGKSTIIRLIFRFYDVQEGAVLINGCDIRNYAQKDVRSRIGIVPQDTVLLNRTIKENICYGRTGASESEIHEAVRDADLLSFIEKLPQGFDTLVGERGLKLSGGEKQKVAIARALLKQPSLMIFDEATSSLDTRSEQSILRSLDKIADRMSTFSIAHRLSTVVRSQKILVMHEGEIIEEGNHTELLKATGAYAKMWEAQQEKC